MCNWVSHSLITSLIQSNTRITSKRNDNAHRDLSGILSCPNSIYPKPERSIYTRNPEVYSDGPVYLKLAATNFNVLNKAYLGPDTGLESSQ